MAKTCFSNGVYVGVTGVYVDGRVLDVEDVDGAVLDVDVDGRVLDVEDVDGRVLDV